MCVYMCMIGHVIDVFASMCYKCMCMAAIYMHNYDIMYVVASSCLCNFRPVAHSQLKKAVNRSELIFYGLALKACQTENLKAVP